MTVPQLIPEIIAEIRPEWNLTCVGNGFNLACIVTNDGEAFNEANLNNLNKTKFMKERKNPIVRQIRKFILQ